MPDQEDTSRDAPGRWTRGLRRAGRLLDRVDTAPPVVGLVQAVRRRLPGDPDWGDHLTVRGSDPAQWLGGRVRDLRAGPSAVSEVALSALQVWRDLPVSRRGAEGERDVAVLFTDLVGFSSWALVAGDEEAVAMLRAVVQAVEPPVARHGGAVVKRLGDGMMAVFDDAPQAVRAGHEAVRAVAGLEVPGHRPQLRAGVHAGRARRVGDDWFGVVVNVAARVGDAARPGEVLVTEGVRELLDDDWQVKRRWWFRADGVPRGTKAYRVVGRGGGG